MPRRKIDGYIFRQQIVTMRQAVGIIRHSLRRLNDEKPGPQTSAMLIAKAAMALSEIQDGLVEVERLVSDATEKGVKDVSGNKIN